MFSTVRNNDIVIANERHECSNPALKTCHCEQIFDLCGNPGKLSTNINTIIIMDHHSRAKALLRDDIYSNSYYEDPFQAYVTIQ